MNTKSFGGVLLMFIAIAVLIVPAAATYQIESQYTEHIFAVEGDYANGVSIGIVEPINNISAFASSPANLDGYQAVFGYNPARVIGEEVGSDTAFMENKPGSSDQVYEGNFVTYTGGGNYSITVNYSANLEESSSTARYLGVALNFTSKEMGDYDFIRVTTDYDDASYYMAWYGNSAHHYAGDATATNEILFVPSLYYTAWANERPNATVYLQIGSKSTDQLGSDEPATINISIEGFNLEGADVLTFTDESMFVIVVVACDFMLGAAILFATDAIDISYDKPKRRRK